MPESRRTYLAALAAEARAREKSTDDPAVRVVHRELADRLECELGELPLDRWYYCSD